MNHTQGHSERTMFAPRGAWQSGVSADFFALGYDAFGSLLPGRNYSSGSYRYLFQGQEHDDEINGGVGTSYAFEYRMHDPRVGRFLSIDPLARKYPFYSPYSFSGNRVIDMNEIEGLEPGRSHAYRLLTNQLVAKVNTANEVAAKTLYVHEYVTGQAPTFRLKVSSYLNAYFHEFGEYTSVNDVSVLKDGRNTDGTEATKTDYVFAGVGLFLPVSGATLKAGMKGIGGAVLEQVVRKVDNLATALDDKHIRAAVGDILGEPVIIAGRQYDHLTEVQNAMTGLGNQIDKLNKGINAGTFSDEVLEEAQRVRSGLQKEKDRLTNILTQAEKEAASKK